MIVGTNGDDLIDGDAGNDLICSEAGDDIIRGDLGPADPATGDDRIDGGPGEDAIFGGDGADGVAGGAGGDIVAPGLGNDAADAAAPGVEDGDSDQIVFEFARGPVKVHLASGRATGEGHDAFSGFEHASGGCFDDTIRGTDGLNPGDPLAPARARHLARDRRDRGAAARTSGPRRHRCGRQNPAPSRSPAHGQWGQSGAIRRHHRQMIDLAKEAMLKQPVSVRDVRGSTLALRAEDYERAVEIVRDCHRRLQKLEALGSGDYVYRLNSQFFRMTGEEA